MFNKLTPNLMTKSILTISIADLQARGIRCLLFDMDNTITYWRSEEIDEEIIDWFAHLSDLGMRACVLSNSRIDRVGKVSQKLNLPCVASSKKPFSGGFRRALNLMNVKKEETAIIGDQLFTDVLGGNRMGLYTILVEPRGKIDHIGTKLFYRKAERLVMPYVRKNVQKNSLEQNRSEI